MSGIALIGGTGLYDWDDACERFEPDTPFGAPSAPVAVTRRGSRRLMFLARHGAGHAIAPHRVNYRANLHALKELGADSVIAINTVGAIAPDRSPGSLIVPDQLIDYTWGRAHTFWEGDGGIEDHAELGDPFTPDLRERLLRAGRKAGVRVKDGGCIGVTQGPRFETRAEVRRLGRDGCDLVGMTSMPEAGLARELGLAYASLCVVANSAAGVGDAVVSLDAIRATLADGMHQVRRLVDAFLDEGD